MAFCIDLISRKIEASIRTLEKCIRRSPAWEKAMERAYADMTRLECDPPHDIVSLRALEAGNAAAYFRAWRAVPLKWVGTGRRAIPHIVADNRLANVALQAGGQPERGASSQCNFELCLRRA